VITAAGPDCPWNKSVRMAWIFGVVHLSNLIFLGLAHWFFDVGHFPLKFQVRLGLFRWQRLSITIFQNHRVPDLTVIEQPNIIWNWSDGTWPTQARMHPLCERVTLTPNAALDSVGQFKSIKWTDFFIKKINGFKSYLFSRFSVYTVL